MVFLEDEVRIARGPAAIAGPADDLLGTRDAVDEEAGIERGGIN